MKMEVPNVMKSYLCDLCDDDIYHMGETIQ